MPGASNFFNVLAWSADGEWIAVNGGSEDQDEDAVSVIPVGGGETRVVQVPDRGTVGGALTPWEAMDGDDPETSEILTDLED